MKNSAFNENVSPDFSVLTFESFDHSDAETGKFQELNLYLVDAIAADVQAPAISRPSTWYWRCIVDMFWSAMSTQYLGISNACAGSM